MFASAYLSNLPAIQQCFSLTTNQQTVLSAKPSTGEQSKEAIDDYGLIYMICLYRDRHSG